ncbi:MAG: EAL domain-containing protein [Sulfuricaulis sp.]
MYIMVLFISLMLIIYWVEESRVSDITQQGVSITAERQSVGWILSDIAKYTWTADAALNHDQIPESRRRIEAQQFLQTALESAVALADHKIIKRSPATLRDALDLATRIRKLNEKISGSVGKSGFAGIHDITAPFFADIRASVRMLEKTLDTQSVKNRQAELRAVDRLMMALWLATLIGIAAILTGFLLFERSIIKPIARITAAFRDEAEGLKKIEIRYARTEEMQNLVSAFSHMRQRIHARQLRLETILHNAAEGIITFDTEGRIESFNQAAERLFGYAEEEVTGKDLRLIIPPQTRESREDYLTHFIRTEIQHLIGHEGEVTGRHKDGSNFPMALKISAMTLEGKQLYTGLVADISERKAMLENLKNMAEHDGLTGLYNRSYFQQELERVVERVKRAGGICCALLYIDLDNFKYVNDTLGHTAGDRLIIEVAGILHRRARKSDLIARIGGDEFSVLLFDTTPAFSVQTAESFRTKIADYVFMHSGENIDIGCSIGVTAISPNTSSATAVLSQADLACHLAKRGGRNRVHLYNPDDAENVSAMSLDMGWSRRIKDAIENDRFVLARQPIINCATREIESHEVLIRMLDERDEIIMPTAFLSTAERFGLSAEIDKWVIQKAIEGLAKQRVTSPQARYAINLSGGTLTTPGICELIQDTLGETRVDPSALTFEVTETVAIADMLAAGNFLSRLRSMGCHTALDDFGSGMSSFAYLKDLPVHYVKIDGRFVKNLATSPVDQAMVKAMNEIVHALGKKTVAEFVENEASFKLLIEYGVDFAQGYYLGRPDILSPTVSHAHGRGATGNDKT